MINALNPNKGLEVAYNACDFFLQSRNKQRRQNNFCKLFLYDFDCVFDKQERVTQSDNLCKIFKAILQSRLHKILFIRSKLMRDKICKIQLDAGQ